VDGLDQNLSKHSLDALPNRLLYRLQWKCFTLSIDDSESALLMCLPEICGKMYFRKWNGIAAAQQIPEGEKRIRNVVSIECRILVGLVLISLTGTNPLAVAAITRTSSFVLLL
jgi:hypothetical protein